MPIARVQMPDGRIGRFDVPTDYSPAQIEDLANQTHEVQSVSTPIVQPQQSPNFFDRISNDFYSRVAGTTESLGRMAYGDQSGLSTGLQVMGQGAGLIGDVAGNVAGTAINAVGNTVAPENYNSAKQYLGGKLNEVAQDIGPSINDFQQNHPITAANLGAINNIAMLSPIGDMATIVANPVGKTLQKTGRALTNSGINAEADAAKQAALDFIQPKQTNKILTNAAKKQGVDFETGKANFISKDADIAKTVSEIPGIDFKKNNIQDNLSLVSKAYADEANSLRGKLEESGVTFSQKEFQNQLIKFKNKIQNTPGLTSTERTATNKAVNEMIQITDRSNGKLTLGDVLDARQKLDKTTLTKSGDLTSANEKIYREGLRPLRNLANEFIAKKLPDADVLASLKKQHELKSAIDNVATKVPSEAKEAQNAQGFLGRNAKTLVGAAGAGGVGLEALHVLGLGAIAGNIAPYVAAGAITYQGGKLAVNAFKSPEVRKALGATLSKTGTLMRSGKQLKVTDITAKELEKMPHKEAKQILMLQGPIKEMTGNPSAEMLANKQNVMDAQNFSLPIRGEGTVQRKMLPAPDRNNPNVIVSSGKPITHTAFPRSKK